MEMLIKFDKQFRYSMYTARHWTKTLVNINDWNYKYNSLILLLKQDECYP